jgi:DNA-binding IclR family transcriptional regulator
MTARFECVAPMEDSAIVETDEVTWNKRVAHLESIAGRHSTEAAHGVIRTWHVGGRHVGERSNRIERAKGERRALNSKVDHRTRPSVIDARATVEEDPIERGEGVVVLGVIFAKGVHDCGTVRHCRISTLDVVLDAMEKLEPGRGLAGRKIGMRTKPEVGVCGAVGVGDSCHRDVRLHIPDGSEVGVSNCADPRCQFEIEIRIDRAPTEPSDPSAQEIFEPTPKNVVIVEDTGAVARRRFGHRARRPSCGSRKPTVGTMIAVSHVFQPAGVIPGLVAVGCPPDHKRTIVGQRGLGDRDVSAQQRRIEEAFAGCEVYSSPATTAADSVLSEPGVEGDELRPVRPAQRGETIIDSDRFDGRPGIGIEVRRVDLVLHVTPGARVPFNGTSYPIDSNRMTSEPSPSTTGESPVDRAFRLLQTVVAAGESVGIRELSRRSGLPRSTVARLVGNLADLGMVTRASDGSVLPGSALSTLQSEAAQPLLSDQLRPLLSELAATFGENAALSIDDGESLLYLELVKSSNPVSVPDVSNLRHRFHLVAPGLLTMAWWDQGRLDSYLRGIMSSATDASMTSAAALTQRVQAVREKGHVWTDQELDVGVNGLAVPVLSTPGDLLASISLYGPSYRFAPQIRSDLASELANIVSNRAAALLGRQPIAAGRR